jgi:hypothetical protein
MALAPSSPAGLFLACGAGTSMRASGRWSRRDWRRYDRGYALILRRKIKMEPRPHLHCQRNRRRILSTSIERRSFRRARRGQCQRRRGPLRLSARTDNSGTAPLRCCCNRRRRRWHSPRPLPAGLFLPGQERPARVEEFPGPRHQVIVLFNRLVHLGERALGVEASNSELGVGPATRTAR